MAIVNDWLQRNTSYAVMTCECIERSVNKDGVVESDTTIRMKGIFSVTSFVRGIRFAQVVLIFLNRTVRVNSCCVPGCGCEGMYLVHHLNESGSSTSFRSQFQPESN